MQKNAPALDKKSQLISALQGRILALELAPGTTLEEAEIAAQSGLSRTPVREVFQRLAGQGYLTLAPGQAPAVSSMDFARMRLFFQTAPMVYAATTRLAAEARGAGRLDELRAIQVSFRATARGADPSRSAILNHRFHGLIGDMAANPYLSAALDRLLIDHTRLSQMFFAPATAEDTALIARAVEDHDAIIEAIADGAAAQAVDLTMAHWALSRDRMERFVRPDPLTDPLTQAPLSAPTKTATEGCL
ncbi:MAG: GntR family transcriptional regulator [Pseudomonadota bacterium]